MLSVKSMRASSHLLVLFSACMAELSSGLVDSFFPAPFKKGLMGNLPAFSTLTIGGCHAGCPE